MTLWVVRTGRYGERENQALEMNQALIGWDALPDLSNIASREALNALIAEHYPDYDKKQRAGYTGQIWSFIHDMEVGDLIFLPRNKRAALAVAEVVGAYQYDAEAPSYARHTRPVRWLRTDLPRGDVDQDILQSLSSTLTVFRINKDEAEARVRRVLTGRTPPKSGDNDEASDEESAVEFDVSAFAADQIRSHIGRHFRGHDFAYLIDGILQAQGYTTHVSPPGPDAGIDILAGSGPMGLDRPRIAVQVKSGDAPLDVSVLRELQGVMPRFEADQGLIVSWGGFKDSVLQEARSLFFRIRLWDSGDVIAALSQHYHQLPDPVQAEIPMKQVWAMVVEE